MNKDELIEQLNTLAKKYDSFDPTRGEEMRKLIEELDDGFRDATSIKINDTMILKKYNGEGTDSEPVEIITRTTGM